MLFDTFSNINSIVEQDKTVTTYKYSLLQSVIESCQEYPQYAIISSGRAHLPLGICVMKWMVYYYPFFTPGEFISMLNGERTSAYKVAFRPEFEAICAYYECHGGLSVFYDDIMHGSFDPESLPVVTRLARKLTQTIADNPMRHLGYSLHHAEYAVFELETKAKQFRKSGPLSLNVLIENCGTYSISEELYAVFRDLGGFILGNGTIRQKWMEFLLSKNKDDGISEAELLERFSQVPVCERDVSAASQTYHEMMKNRSLCCVWSDKKLTPATLAVDHLLPFAVWKSNELWNLMPADAKINLNKSDQIPSRQLLEQRKDVITAYWDRMHAAYPKRFEDGIAVGLLRGKFVEDWKELAFRQLCEISEYLTHSRGCQEWAGPKQS